MNQEEQVIYLKQNFIRIYDSLAVIRTQLPLIRSKLQLATSHREPNAYRRAYSDVSSLLSKTLKRIPERMPEILLFERPKAIGQTISRILEGDRPIPIINKAGTIYMGCYVCHDWIDITKVFTDGLSDGVYACPNKHKVIFGTIDKSETN